MEFRKDDENYIYQVIGRNVKKYRKLKGYTQEQLAEKIDYSLSFVSAIESAYHQTFSLGAIWRISRVLDIEFTKLCEDEDNKHETRYIKYKCEKCNNITKMPIKVVEHFSYINKLTNNKNLPVFDCTECDGTMKPINPMEL